MATRKVGSVKRRDPKRTGASRPAPERSRSLEIKFRVRPLVRMPRSELFRLLKEIAATGVVSERIEVAYMDYGHKSGAVLSPGTRLSVDELSAFDNLLAVLGASEERGTVRFERTGG